jgi:hypothetical protein
MEKFEFIVLERKNGRLVCLNKYLYRKRKTVGEKDYYSCVEKCSASLHSYHWEKSQTLTRTIKIIITGLRH